MSTGLERWIEFEAVHPAPTFFSRPAFALALQDTFSHIEAAPVWVHHRGRDFVVPAVRSRARLRPTEADAFPFGGYSCIMAPDGSVADAASSAAVLRSAAAENGAFRYIGWPLAEQPRVPGFEITPYETAVIDCSGGVEAALSGMRGVTRRMVGQAIRRGVVCERHAADEAGLATYYAMLEEASAGWGLEAPTIPRTLLDAVARRGGDDVELWFAMLEGEPIAGGVILFGRDELFFWSAAMKREFSRFRPSNALNARLIERACERGVRWYNLGASEGLTGVERFKTDLGATAVPYARITARKPSYRAFTALRNVLKTRHAS